MDIQKKTKIKLEEADSDYDAAINELANIVVDNIHEEYRNDLEPFEVYAQKVRSQLHANIGEFRSRFVNGYRVLIEELRKKQ